MIQRNKIVEISDCKISLFAEIKDHFAITATNDLQGDGKKLAVTIGFYFNLCSQDLIYKSYLTCQ